VMQSILGPIRMRANHILQRIAGTRFDDVQFDESLLPSGISPKSVDDAVSLDQISGGEREQVYFAVRMALADVAFTDDLVTAVDDTPAKSGVTVHQNVPNPFNPSTRISFDLQQREDVSISVYDVKGRLVHTLFDGVLEAGPHSVDWDGTSAEGTRVSSGVYLYVVRTSTETVSRRMVLLK